MKTTYEWSWTGLALWKCTDWGDGGASNSRLFTLRPDWLLQGIWRRIKYGEDPFDDCYRWLKKTGHYDEEDFTRAVTWWYANHSQPCELARLNPKLLK